MLAVLPLVSSRRYDPPATNCGIVNRTMRYNEIINEGPFRTLGMAAAVAGGLMGSPAHAAQDLSPQISMEAKWDNFMRSFVTIPANQREQIVAKLGNPKDYIQKMKGQKTDAELLDDWLAQAQRLSVDLQTMPPKATMDDFWNAEGKLRKKMVSGG